MTDDNKLTRKCLFCNAVFEGDNTLDRLLKHKETCTSDTPFIDDDTTDYYGEEVQQ